MWWMMVAAMAGEIEVEMQTPVLFKVDGELVNDLGNVNRATGLEAGAHTVTAENLLGRTVATLTVDVPADQRVLVRYARKKLTVVSTKPLGSGAATPVVPAASGGSAPTTTSSEPVADGAAAVGSLAFIGLPSAGHRIVVGEKEAVWTPARGAYVVGDLPAGKPLSVAVHRNGEHVRTDVITMAPGDLQCDLGLTWGQPFTLERCVPAP
jgi:hypothetical protein